MKQCPSCNYQLNKKEASEVVLLSKHCPKCGKKLKNASTSAILLVLVLPATYLVEEAFNKPVSEQFFWVALLIVGAACLISDIFFTPFEDENEVKPTTKQMLLELKGIFAINRVVKSLIALFAILTLAIIAVYNLANIAVE